MVTREGSLAIVEISKEGVYVVTAMEVAAVKVAAVEVASVVVSGAGEELRLVAAVVVVVKDASISMASWSTAAMSLIDVNDMSVVSYS